MIKLLITDRHGESRVKVLNTAAAHRVMQVPSIIGAVKCEIVKEQEKTEPPVVEIIEKEVVSTDEYNEENYQQDVEQAKKLKDEVPIEVLERMVAFKPTPYWKGKLNKIK